MQEPDVVRYKSVPRNQSWMIPFWDKADRDEFADLADSIRHKGPERFADPLTTLKRTVTRSDPVGARFYVGTQLPSRVTLTLAPDTGEQAIAILAEASGFMTSERGLIPWRQIGSRLDAIRTAVKKSDDGAYPSFGFSVIIQSQAGYKEASADWFSEMGHSDSLI